MNLGIHASVRIGFLNALKQAVQNGCRTLQIFPHRPGTPFRMPAESEAVEVAAFRKEHSISPVAVHSVYQPNIASTNLKIRRRSRESLLEELRFTAALGAEFLVVHSGSYSPDSNLEDGIRRSAEAFRWALNEEPGAKILIENVGGGGRRIGGKFEELKALLDGVGEENRVGICFDTAHAFASGFPLNEGSGLEDCLAFFDKTIGLKRLELFHINDSRAERGSHKDIHEHIGKGRIGLEPLRRLVNDKRFEAVAGVIETPKLPPGSDASNLRLLREEAG